MISFGLKPWEEEDIAEAKTIISAFATQDDDEASPGTESQAGTGGGSQRDQGKAKEK